jgi:hypothetical protein
MKSDNMKKAVQRRLARVYGKHNMKGKNEIELEDELMDENDDDDDLDDDDEEGVSTKNHKKAKFQKRHMEIAAALMQVAGNQTII